jgi:hypothetical protein
MKVKILLERTVPGCSGKTKVSGVILPVLIGVALAISSSEAIYWTFETRQA